LKRSQQLRLSIRLIVFSLAAAGVMLYAQGTSGNISGQVLDPSGLSIPGVRIAATNLATNVITTATSTDTGNYNLIVPPGLYRLTAEATGFKQFLQNNVTVTASASVRVDAALEVGSVSEMVEVKGKSQTVQSDNAKITTAVENKFVDELPLVVGGALRNPYDLVSISAQVMTTGTTEMALGGAQARSWNATLDGLSITTNRSAEKFEVAYAAPSVEAITEFAVDTNGFKAEYGQSSGGIVTFSSRSGTNALHGVAYDFLRNQKLDARAFFDRQKPVYKQNDFGVAAGGPVRIPKLYNGRNRTFFYLTYEGFRNRVGGNSTIQSVPTPEMYNGDFSKWVDSRSQLLPLYDPATTRPNPAGAGFLRDPFVNNQIPKARFSKFSQVIIPYAQGVTPNRGGVPGTSDYVRNNWIKTGGSIQSPQDKGSAKIDHLITNSHRLGFFYNITRARDMVGADGPPGLPLPLYGSTYFKWDISSYRMTYDWIVSPTTFNQVNVGGNLFWRVQDSLNYGGNWKSKGVCFQNVIDCDLNFPNISFTEFNGWGGSARSGLEAPMWALKDDLSHTHGKHTYKFGASYQLQKSSGTGEQNISGQATFSYLGTSVPGDTAFRSGGSFASFLLGDANSGATESRRDNTFVYPYYGFYAQDDWRIARRLTLNLGVRYDLSPAPTVDNDWHSDFAPNRPNPAINNFPGALRFGGFGPGRENSRTLVDGWYKGIGPRIGLAYSLDNKTSIRAAFGRSFGRVLPFRDSGHYQGFIGRYNFSSPDQGITPAFNWDKGLPPYPLPQSLNSSASLDPAFANNDEVHYYNGNEATRSPESLYWTIGVQREIAVNTILEVTYAATIGTHLDSSLLNFNQVPTPVWNSYVARYGAAGARNLLLSDINSSLARSAGVPIPYPNFVDPAVQATRNVGQALRPWPQFLWVVTGVRGSGDHSGHSSYHAVVAKISRRYHNGLTFEWNYSLSKLLTDADSQVAGNGTTQDQYNRRMEKSIGGFDQTHSVKFSTVYELPFGRGRRFLGSSGGFVNAVLGGWRVAGIETYASGFPIHLSRNNILPIFNGETRPVINTYDNWRAPIKGDKFDPAVDRFLNLATFPTQPIDFGNATRYNPKTRTFPIFNENISMAKTFALQEKLQLNLRWEAFNLFNRALFGIGPTNLNSATFGVVTSQMNDPRRMQVGLKLYW
jgi:hypothetical protein